MSETPSPFARVLQIFRKPSLADQWADQVVATGERMHAITATLRDPEIIRQWQTLDLDNLNGHDQVFNLQRIRNDLPNAAKPEADTLLQLVQQRERAASQAGSLRLAMRRKHRDHHPEGFEAIEQRMIALENMAQDPKVGAVKDSEILAAELRTVAENLGGKLTALLKAPRAESVPFQQARRVPTLEERPLPTDGSPDLWNRDRGPEGWEAYRELDGEHEAIRELVGRHTAPLHQPSETAMPPHPPMREIEPLDIPAAAPIPEHGTPGAHEPLEAGYHELLEGLDPEIQDQVAARLEKKGLPVPPALTREIEIVEQSIEHKPRSMGGMVIGGVVAAAALIGGWALAHDAKQSERNPYTGR